MMKTKLKIRTNVHKSIPTIDNKILTSLEEAGLRPREAKYYE